MGAGPSESFLGPVEFEAGSTGLTTLGEREERLLLKQE